MRSKAERIIDANINRAGEGLRVMEEVVRFVLEDKKLTAELKELRGQLREIIKNLVENEIHFQQRRALKDVGNKLYTANESKRISILDIFTANVKRVQEALRVLEEFSKLIKPGAGKSIKGIRFKVYELEKIIALRVMRYLSLDFNLYVVSDPMRDHLEVAKGVIAGGGKIIQLRDKKASKKQYLKWAKNIRRLTRKAGATFIVNDYLDIAKQVDADGLHLGQKDLAQITIARAKKELGAAKIIGISTHNLAQALRAGQKGADYISFGPIFATPSKPETKPLGLRKLQRVIERLKIPVVAIGGINSSNLPGVLKTGCQRIAVIRAVLEKKNIGKAVRLLGKEILAIIPQ